MRFTVDPWDPSYGTSTELDPAEESKAVVDSDIEVPARQWAPRRPASSRGGERIVFVDGVRRVEAHVWIDAGDGTAHHGICASYAAGAVRCDGAAVCGPIKVGRGLFSAYGGAEPVTTTAGPFAPHVAAAATLERLSIAVQDRMAETELEAAEEACGTGDVDFVVIDGPLRGRQHLTGAVGYVKTHHVTYLRPELHAMVGRLLPGERSPLFTVGTDWSRLSWYFRLPGVASPSPWSGIVRGECSTSLPIPQAAAVADQVTAALPRFASAPHKDTRSPQNLYPIAGLERELRHRLGDPQLLYRALRVAAAAG
jgi:hypothetical protein